MMGASTIATRRDPKSNLPFLRLFLFHLYYYFYLSFPSSCTGTTGRRNKLQKIQNAQLTGIFHPLLVSKTCLRDENGKKKERENYYKTMINEGSIAQILVYMLLGDGKLKAEDLRKE
jgi:hypothetical protein